MGEEEAEDVRTTIVEEGEKTEMALWVDAARGFDDEDAALMEELYGRLEEASDA